MEKRHHLVLMGQRVSCGWVFKISEIRINTNVGLGAQRVSNLFES